LNWKKKNKCVKSEKRPLKAKKMQFWGKKCFFEAALVNFGIVMTKKTTCLVLPIFEVPFLHMWFLISVCPIFVHPIFGSSYL